MVKRRYHGLREMGIRGLMKLLVKKGGDMESKDEGGQTPLSWAAVEGHEAVVQLPIEKGADINCLGKLEFGRATQPDSCASHRFNWSDILHLRRTKITQPIYS